MIDDTISRQAVLKILNSNLSNGFRDYNGDWWDPTIDADAINEIKALPSTCHLLEDGTLVVEVQDLSAVHRVAVIGVGR